VYQASVVEDAPVGTLITTVAAVDADAGELGHITYSLVGSKAEFFDIGEHTGEIRVRNSSVLDREERMKISLEVVATDGAPSESQKRSAALVWTFLLS